LLQPLEGLAARIEFTTSARDDAAGFQIVDLYAFLALGRKAKLCLGFEAVSLREGTNEDLAVINGDRALINNPLSRFAAVQRTPNCALGRDKKFDALLPSFSERRLRIASLFDQVTGSPFSY
jgi:hypothetical protein